MMPGAFANVQVFAPARRDDPSAAPDVATRDLGVDAFFWTLEEFATEELCRSCSPTPRTSASSTRWSCTTSPPSSSATGKPWATAPGASTARRCVPTASSSTSIVDRVTNDDTRAEWAGPATGMGTVNAFVRRLLSSQRSLARLVRADVAASALVRHRIDTAGAQVTVVDLHNLDDRAKRFVVGVTLRVTFDEKERSGQARPLLFVVLDELNKYAPRDGESPIKEILLDVAERGRSLGIILIGAQQTASEVERRIITNSSIRVVGRLDAAEAARPEYGFLPKVHQQRAVIAKPGTMFVHQPEIPVPLVVEFPFPAWATRPSETGANSAEAGDFTIPDDLLEGVPRGPRS